MAAANYPSDVLSSESFPVLESTRLRLVPVTACPQSFFDFVSYLLAIPRVGESLWGHRKAFEPPPGTHHSEKSTGGLQEPPPPRRRSTGCGIRLTPEQMKGFEDLAKKHFTQHGYGVWAIESNGSLPIAAPASIDTPNGRRFVPRSRQTSVDANYAAFSFNHNSSPAQTLANSISESFATDNSPLPSPTLEEFSVTARNSSVITKTPPINGLFGQYIGFVEIRHFPPDTTCSKSVIAEGGVNSLGVWISPESQNNGYGFEAAKRVLKYCFCDPPKPRTHGYPAFTPYSTHEAPAPTLKPPLTKVFAALLPERPMNNRLCSKLGMKALHNVEFPYAATEAWYEAMFVVYDSILEEDYQKRVAHYEQQKQTGGNSPASSLGRPRQLMTNDIPTPPLTYWEIKREDFLDFWIDEFTKQN